MNTPNDRPPRRVVRVAAVLLALSFACAERASARGWFVALNGRDSNVGTIANPWRSVAAGIGKLRPGDTLYVRGGQYFERPVVTVSGTEAAPIVVRSYPGEVVTLDSGYPEFQTPGNAAWELVNAATGEYRTRQASYADDNIVYGYVVPAFPYENGRVGLVPYHDVAHFRATSDRYDPAGFYVGPGTWAAPDGRVHVRLAKTADLRATEARYGKVFAADLPNPADHALILTRASYTLRVAGAHLVFLGLVLNPAAKTIDLRAGAHHLRFDGITAWMGNRAIEAEQAGVHHVTVVRSRLYGDRPQWIFWSDMKDAPYPADRMRATTIDLRAGTHHWEIAYCHVRGSGQDLLGTADAESDLSIHHNRFENAGDDALELEGSLGRTEVFENFFLNCLTAVAPGQDSPGFQGPLFVYRNVICSLRNPPVNREAGINTWNGGGRFGYEYVFKHNGSDFGTKDAHYYHNTIVLLNSGGKGVNLTPKFPQGTRVANNLLVTLNGPVNGAYTLGADQVVDGNLYWRMNPKDVARLVWSYDHVPALAAATGLEAHGLGSTPKRGTDPRFAALPLVVADPTKTVWELTAASEQVLPSGLLLGTGSPARNAGIVIPAHTVHGTMPDSRSSRDIGAIPYGTPAAEYQRFPFDPSGSGGVLDAPGPPAGGGTGMLPVRVQPNPTRGRTQMRFTLAKAGPARLSLHDVQGRLVRVVLDTPWLPAGPQALEFDVGHGASALLAGVYFYRLFTGAGISRGRLVVRR